MTIKDKNWQRFIRHHANCKLDLFCLLLLDLPSGTTLPEYLGDPELLIDNFRHQLKTFLFAQYWRWHPSTLETLVPVRSINLLFTFKLVLYHL